ncbi:MAG: GFA family protein [Maricaulaceae bacterium]
MAGTETSTTLKGACHCGGVEFEVPAQSHVDTCHCNICRRLTSGPFIGMECHSGLKLLKSESLKWYDSSEWARRGFCGECGANLFYNLKGSEFYSISAGALNIPAGTELTKELFIDEKPDYYAIAGERIRMTGEEVFASFNASNEGENND